MSKPIGDEASPPPPHDVHEAVESPEVREAVENISPDKSLRAEIAGLEAERDGYRAAYQKIAAELGSMKTERDGFRDAYRQIESIVGSLRADVAGYRKSYETIAAEVGGLRAERDNERTARQEMEARIGTVLTERDGYKAAYDQIASESGSLKSEREGYKTAYEIIASSSGSLRTDVHGYKAAYEQTAAEFGAIRAELERLRTDADGYKTAYEQTATEIGAVRAELENQRTIKLQIEAQIASLQAERDGYKSAYDQIAAEISTMRSERDGYKCAYEDGETQRGQERATLAAVAAELSTAKSDLERLQGEAALKTQAIQRETRNAGLVARIPELIPTLGSVFGHHVPGPNKNALILNSVPKAGTYLLLETVKCFDQFTDTEFHAYSDSLRRLGKDGRFDNERNIPAVLWSAALRPGTMCVSHVEYDPIVEQYFSSRPDLKTIFIIRDPRDLVVSWVDFVYSSSSYPEMAGWNAYERKMTELHPTSDEQRLLGSIEGLLRSGISSYTAWIDSPSCLTVKFEDLYAALLGDDVTAGGGVLDRIADHLDLPRRAVGEFQASLGKGLTSSGRQDKIGVYKRRMNAAHIERLKKSDFQKVVIDFGYEPT